MNSKIVRALVLVCAFAGIAFTAACGGGGGSSSSSGSEVSSGATQTGQSSAQNAFRTARNNPDFFDITFVGEELGSDGLAVAVNPPRRLENWTYNRGTVTQVLFDDGFFVRETNLGAQIAIPPTTLNPTQFLPSTTKADVIALLGQPSCEENITVAGKNLNALRFNATPTRTVVSVVFVGSTLSSVVAGYSIRIDGGNGAGGNLCS